MALRNFYPPEGTFLTGKVSLPDVKLSRPVRLLGYISGSLATVALLGWAYLYADSIHQRHRAEALIADLKKFPFQSATFTTVREFTLSHGGSPTPELRLSEDPHIKNESSEANRNPAGEYDFICAPSRCTFEISIANKTHKFVGNSLARYRVFDVLGVRPWSLVARFTVTGGQLHLSSTSVGTVVFRRNGSSDQLVAVEYDSVTRSASDPNGWSPYTVARPHITGGTFDILQSRLLQIPAAPIERAYDIDLHCLTAVTSTCTQSQLAPSAWADYHHLRD